MNRFEFARASLSSMVQLLRELPDVGHGMLVVVPDTSVLLDLSSQTDQVDGKLAWTTLRGEWWQILVVMAPQVVKELDRLKVAHRGKALGRSAQDIIRYLNEIRQSRRSIPAFRAEEGVQIDFLMTEPIEADRSLFPWLDSSLADHRILLSTLDAARRWPRDRVVLATRDLHMALLASYAEIDAFDFEGPSPQGTSRPAHR